MNPSDQLRFNTLYQEHLNALSRQGKAPATIDGYSPAARRITEHFDICPGQLINKLVDRLDFSIGDAQRGDRTLSGATESGVSSNARTKLHRRCAGGVSYRPVPRNTHPVHSVPETPCALCLQWSSKLSSLPQAYRHPVVASPGGQAGARRLFYGDLYIACAHPAFYDVSVRRLVVLRSGCLQTDPHGAALAVG